jgi:hypothetical protein
MTPRRTSVDYLEVVWKTVTEDLPALLPVLGRVVEAVRKGENPANDSPQQTGPA